MKFRYDLKFINRNGFELTFKLSIAFFIVKDKRSITFGSFEKQACSNISFLHKFCRLKKSLKVVVGAQTTFLTNWAVICCKLLLACFFVKINRQTAQSHVSNLKLRQSLTNRVVML